MSDADLVAGGNVNFGRELERDEWKEKIRKLLSDFKRDKKEYGEESATRLLVKRLEELIS